MSDAPRPGSTVHPLEYVLLVTAIVAVIICVALLLGQSASDTISAVCSSGSTDNAAVVLHCG